MFSLDKWEVLMQALADQLHQIEQIGSIIFLPLHLGKYRLLDPGSTHNDLVILSGHEIRLQLGWVVIPDVNDWRAVLNLAMEQYCHKQSDLYIRGFDFKLSTNCHKTLFLCLGGVRTLSIFSLFHVLKRHLVIGEELLEFARNVLVCSPRQFRIQHPNTFVHSILYLFYIFWSDCLVSKWMLEAARYCISWR